MTSMETESAMEPVPHIPPVHESFDTDGSTKDYSAIHGNFIPLQSSEGLFLIPPRRTRSPRRLRSRSPRRRRQEPGVHLHLSLTDSQMDKLTSTFDKDETPQPKTHRRSGTVDGSCSGTTMHQIPSAVHRPPPPPPLPFNKVSQAVSVLANTQHSQSSFAHSARGRIENRQDSMAYASTEPLSSPTYTQVNTRSMSPSKFSRTANESTLASTAATSVADTSMNRRSLESRPATRGTTGETGNAGNGSSSAAHSPSKSHRQIFEDPEMTDASSSVYSMDELIRAMPHIHPLYVKRIAEMGSPSRTPGHSPEHSPSALQEYAA
ncbi:hypothetical protein F503_08141 [Ophiostoma piceae UAMH 11346]|uniref:Uncharacterized protein n=1 Tax=Ophiostoma piceae (strain UAMH 11346) TaxID=1262450 RepID=S3D2H7_OPHP1|nr:hypothetical protein F503_08141 [Ophiostoma piceae UAMH 11346]